MNLATGKTFGKRALSILLAIVMFFSLFIGSGMTPAAYADGVNWVHLNGVGGLPNMPGHAVALTNSGFVTLVTGGAAHNHIHTIHLGTNLEPARSTPNRNLTIDGFDPRNSAQTEPFQITRVSTAARHLFVSGGTNRTVRFQNIRIRNENNSGLISGNVSSWTTEFYNVQASGHQFIDMRAARINLMGNNLFELHGNYGAGQSQEFAQINRLWIEGPNNVIRRTGPVLMYSFVWIQDADGWVDVRPGGCVVWDMNGHCPNNYGFTFATGARTHLFVREGGSFRFYGGRYWDGNQSASYGRLNNIHVWGHLSIVIDGNIRGGRNSDSLVHVNNMNIHRGADVVIAAANGATGNRVLETTANLVINYAERFVIYAGGNHQALRSNGRFTMPNNRRVGVNDTARGMSGFTFGNAEYTPNVQYDRDLFVLGPTGFQAQTAASMANFTSTNYVGMPRAPWALEAVPLNFFSNTNVSQIAIYGDFSNPPSIDITFAGDRVIRGTGVPGSYINVWLPDTIGHAGPYEDILVAPDGTWELVLPHGANLVANQRVQATQREIFVRPNPADPANPITWHSSESRVEEIRVFERTLRLEGDNLTKIYYDEGAVATNATAIFGVNAGEVVLPPSELRFVKLAPGTVIPDEDDPVAFEAVFAAATDNMRGVVGVSGMSSSAIPIMANAIIWVQGSVNRNDSDVILGASREFANLYAIRHLYVRGMVAGPPYVIDGRYERQLYPYRRMTTSAGGTQYGVPLDYNGNVIANPLHGFDIVRIAANPQFHFHWTGIIRGTYSGFVDGANMSLTNPPVHRTQYRDFRLDQNFHNATTNQLWDAGQARDFYFYTIEYSPIEGMWWNAVPVRLRAADNSESPITINGTDTTTINMPLDVDYATNLPIVPHQSTRFHHYGGHFVPPSDADRTPTGWFVNPTFNFMLNTLASNFADPAQFNPQVVPITGPPQPILFITYQTGMVTIEEHFIGVNVYRPVISGTENILLTHTTSTIRGDGSVGFTSTAPGIMGQVPVGYRIVGVPGRDGWHPFNFAAFAAANPGTLPTFNQNGLQAILTPAEIEQAGGTIRIEWIFASDSTSSGIPDQEKGTIVINWNGFYVNNAVPAQLAPPQIIRLRTGFDFAVANDMFDTPPGTGNSEHVITRSIHMMFPGTWLFDRWADDPLNPSVLPVNPPAHTINIPENQNFAAAPGAVTDVTFRYAFATDTRMADKNQFVIERFRVLEAGTNTEITHAAMPADGVTYLLRGQTYLRVPPVIPGFLFVGFRIDDGANNITYVQGQPPSNIQFNTSNYNTTVTLLYRAQAEPVTVTWVGTTMGGTEITLGDAIFIGYVGEELTVFLSAVELADSWALVSPAEPFHEITFGTVSQAFEFQLIEDIGLSVIVTRFMSDDGTIIFTMTQYVLPNADPFVITALELANYELECWTLYDMHGNRLGCGEGKEVTIDPSLGSQILTFNYVTNLATVIMRAFNYDDGTEFVNAARQFTGARVGTTFVVQAPHIPGFVLAPGQSLIETVNPVLPGNVDTPGLNEVRFNFVPATGNMTVILREGTPEAPGSIIRVDSIMVAPGDTVGIPDLSAYHFSPIDGQTEHVVAPGDTEVTYFYQIATTPVIIRAINEADGFPIVLTGIVTQVTEQGRRGQMFTATALANIPGFTLVEAFTRNVFVDPTQPYIIVDFVYREEVLGDVIVRHYYIDSDGNEAEILRVVVAAVAESNFQASVMDFTSRGFIPHADTPELQSITVSATEENIVSFRYVDVRLTVTMQYLQKANGVFVLNTDRSFVTRVANGSNFTYAPTYISGYTIDRITVDGVEVSEINISSVTENTIIRIYFEPVRAPITVTVRGVNTATGAELYSYSFMRAVDSGIETVQAFEIPGFDLVRALIGATEAAMTNRAVQINVTNQDMTVTFEYVSLARIITIRAFHYVDSERVPVPSFNPIQVQATSGQTFSANAPFINGFNLRAGDSTTQTINPVTGNAYMDFIYERAIGNVTILLREDTVAGRIIRSESMNIPQGVATVIPIPNLTADHFTVIAGQTPETITFTGTHLTVTYLYERVTRYVTIEMRCYHEGSLLGTIPSHGPHRVTEVASIAAPSLADPDRVFVGLSPRLVVIEPGAGPQVVVFEYRNRAENELVVVALDNTTNTILQSSTIVGPVHSSIRVNAPAIEGFRLREAEQPQRTGIIPGTITFLYEPNVVNITIETVHHISGDPVATPFTVTVARGTTQTFFAPHVPGHVITGPSEVLRMNIQEPETITFHYIPIEEIVNDYLVNLLVIGRAGDLELYRYTIRVPINSGEHIATAFEPQGFALMGGAAARMHTFNAETMNLQHIFEYRSLATHVRIYAVHYENGERVPVPSFVPFNVPAVEGIAFTQRAPHIQNFNLVGDLTQTITPAASGNTMTFLFERAVGNVIIELRDGSFTGPIIRTESRNWTAGETHTVQAPDLSAYFFTARAPQSWTGQFDGSSLRIIFVYDKELVNVTVRGVYINDPTGTYIELVIPGLRRGEVHTFNAPSWDGFLRLGPATQMVLIDTVDAVVIFEYRRAGEGEVVVRSVVYEDGNLVPRVLTEKAITVGLGNSVTVSAPSILGYTLRTMPVQENPQTAAAPGQITFVYVRDVVTVTVNLIHDSTGAPIAAPAGVTTTFEVPRGGNITLFAPHISGFAITGYQARVLTNVTSNQTVEFRYIPIADVGITEPGKGTLRGRVLEEGTTNGIGGATVTIIRDDGTMMVTIADINGYYSFFNVAPGSYTVRANAYGFLARFAETSPITVVADETAETDIYLPRIIPGGPIYTLVINVAPDTAGYIVELTLNAAPIIVDDVYVRRSGNTWIIDSTTPRTGQLVGASASGFQSVTTPVGYHHDRLGEAFVSIIMIPVTEITITFNALHADVEAHRQQVATGIVTGSDYEKAFAQIITPTRQGYIFAGWFNAAGQQVFPHTPLLATATSHELHARWRTAGYGNLWGLVTRDGISSTMAELPSVIVGTYEYEVEVSYESETEVQYEYEVDVEYEYEVQVPYTYEVQVPYEFADAEGNIVTGTTTEIREGITTEVRIGIRTETRTGTRTETGSRTRTENRMGSGSEAELGINAFGAGGNGTTLTREPVEGATIIIVPADGSPVIRTTTDANGLFDQVVPIGNYTVIVSKPNYKTIIHPDSPHHVFDGGRTEASFHLDVDYLGVYRYMLVVNVTGAPANATTVTLDGDELSRNPLPNGVVWTRSGNSEITGLVRAEATGFDYDEKSVATEDYEDGVAVVALTLEQTQRRVVVTFHSNGGTPVVAQTLEVIVGQRYGFAGRIVEPTKTGYTFIGWFTAGHGGEPVNTNNYVSLNAEDHNLFARWAPNTTIVGGGGGGSTIIIVQPEPPLAEALDTEFHFAFVIGYEDGTFRANRSITRAEIAMILFRLIESDAKHANLPSRFSDVSNSSWYAQAINYLASRNLLRGYEDGTFRPTQQITRAELAAIIIRFAEVNYGGMNNFADVANDHWALAYIMTAYEMGWIIGYEDGTFRPDNTATRAETVTMMNRMLSRRPNATTINYHLRGTGLFSDLDNSHWAFFEIMEAAIDHEFYIDENGRELWTRVFLPAR